MKKQNHFLLCLLSLIAFSAYGQQGTTSVGDSEVSADGRHYAYTIGEVFNVHTINGENTNKLGILQPIDRMPTSVVESIESSISLFPNPASDIITVSIQDPEKYSYTIYDALGKAILSDNLSFTDIDISNLVQGSYYIVIQNGVTTTTKKFQKFTSK